MGASLRAPSRMNEDDALSRRQRSRRGRRFIGLPKMEFTPSVSEWLPWLSRVRFLIITFLVMVVVAVRQLTPIQIPVHTLVPLVVLWYTLGGSLSDSSALAAAGAVASSAPNDAGLVIITGVVYATGSQDSDFISLYLLAILMGSILFSGRGAFLVAGWKFSAARLGGGAFLLRSDSANGKLHARSSRA